jgi:anti-sigma B factor antagonist
MHLRRTNSEVDGVLVVELGGRIVLGEESNSLRESLKSMIARGNKKIVLNMANIAYIDSSGLGTLIAAHLSAKNHGASVRLCNLAKNFHEVMQMTKLLTVFDVYDTGDLPAARASEHSLRCSMEILGNVHDHH